MVIFQWNDTKGKGLESNTTKPFRGYVKAKTHGGIGVSALKRRGQLHYVSDSKPKAEVLVNQFNSGFTHDDVTDINIHNIVHPDINISEAGVKFT